jgi:hypothetical protein
VTPPRTLDQALDDLPAGGGTVTVDRDGAEATVEAVDADRLGVRVKRLRVDRDVPVDIEEEAHSLPDRLRSLPDRVVPIEIAPELGGARLRTRPEELRGREWFEVDVDRDGTSIRRVRADEDGSRVPVDWTLTREQLDRLIDETKG